MSNKGTIVRTVALFIAWANVVLSNQGLSTIPVISEEEISLGLAFVSSVFAWFYNNYVTAKGKKQKEVLKNNGLSK